MSNPNPLAEHAHPTMVRIWTEKVMVELERAWWASVMLGQASLGAPIPTIAIAASQTCTTIDGSGRTLERIRQRELQTKHDLKARLEIFCEDAGHEHHHLGMTSADVVENTWQIRIRDSLRHLHIAHSIDVKHLEYYVLRGVHGAVGTDQDQLDLLGSADRVHALNRWLCGRWGFPDYARTVPQVMHRSQDLAVLVPVVSQVAQRLRRGGPGAALWPVIQGYVTMTAGYTGDTWNEGDVSSSVIRRVAIPNILLAISSALQLTGAQDA